MMSSYSVEHHEPSVLGSRASWSLISYISVLIFNFLYDCTRLAIDDALFLRGLQQEQIKLLL